MVFVTSAGKPMYEACIFLAYERRSSMRLRIIFSVFRDNFSTLTQ